MKIIVCGTNFSSAADRACQGAALLARLRGADLLLVHVAPDEPARARARELLAAYVRDRVLHGAVGTEVVVGQAAHELGHVARRVGADVIVIGAAHGPRPLLLTDFEAGLEETAPCPVIRLSSVEDAYAAVHLVAPEPGPVSHCVVCGRQAPERVCASCRQRITWEAQDRTWHEVLGRGRGLGPTLQRAYGRPGGQRADRRGRERQVGGLVRPGPRRSGSG